MRTASDVAAIDDPLEAAYLQRRRIVRRRQFWTGLLLAVLATGYVGWVVGSHLIAAWWLAANHYKVRWSIDEGTWRHGGTTTVRYDDNFFFLLNTRPNVDLKLLPWLHHVEELGLAQSTGLRDDDLVWLAEMTSLRSLDLDLSRNRSGVAYQFWAANHPGGPTDATLARIGALKGLRDLQLGGQGITNAGLANLKGLVNLQSLDLRETEITDEGLEHLKGCRALKTLILLKTKVTAQGVRNFEAAIPGVQVVADPPPAAPPTPTAPKTRANR